MTIVWFLIFTIVFAVSVIGLSTTSCDEFKAFLIDNFNIHLDEKMYDGFCKQSRGGEEIAARTKKLNLNFLNFSFFLYSSDISVHADVLFLYQLCVSRLSMRSGCDHSEYSDILFENHRILLKNHNPNSHFSAILNA